MRDLLQFASTLSNPLPLAVKAQTGFAFARLTAVLSKFGFGELFHQNLFTVYNVNAT